MSTYLTPGVYIQEVETGPQPIQGVSTSITGAVGVTAQGPTSGKPVLVTSFANFQTTFGGYLTTPPASQVAQWMDPNEGGQWWQFPLAVKSYFDNGGQQLYVKRVFAAGGPGIGPGAAAASAVFGQGLAADVMLDAPATATTVKLSHLINISVGTTLNFYTPGNPTALNGAAGLAVASYNAAQNMVIFNNPLGFALKAGRDICVIAKRSANPTPAANVTLNFAAKAFGFWGNNVSVRVAPMVGGTYTILPDPVTGGASASTQLTANGNAGDATITVASTTGFSVGDHARIAGQEYVLTAVTAAANKLGINAIGSTNGLLSAALPGTSVVRLRGASGVGATSIHLSGADGIYVNAILQLDNGLQKDTVQVTGVTGEVVSFVMTDGTAGLKYTYYEGQKARVIEAEVDTQNEVNGTVIASETIQNLRLTNDQSSSYIVTGVNLQSQLVNLTSLGPGFSATILAQFPTAPDVEWVPLAGGDDHNENLTVEDFVGVDGGSGNRTGIQGLIDNTDISICVVPGMWSQTIQAALINHCETLKYRFGILDPPDGLSIDGIIDFRQPLDTEYAALYYPWLQVLDPSVVQNVDLAPSALMAGIYAQTDTTRGVFKAPANVEIAMITKIAQDVNAQEQALLNPIGINALRYFPERGNRVWGARTLSSDTDWMYINVRRLFIYIEASIDNGTQWAVFEPNDQRLWARIRQTITDFLTTTWQQGALQGATPAEAFFVQCDLGVTMTQDDINNGRLICVVGIAPVRPAEFVIFQIQQIMQTPTTSS